VKKKKKSLNTYFNFLINGKKGVNFSVFLQRVVWFFTLILSTNDMFGYCLNFGKRVKQNKIFLVPVWYRTQTGSKKKATEQSWAGIGSGGSSRNYVTLLDSLRRLKH
jgi:hypothetical protein